MADKKISELTSLLAADVATNDVLPIVDSSAIETKKLTAGDLKAYTFAGNIPLTGNAVRITGDFSNATVANRVNFQTNTLNNGTYISTLPNGTGNISGFFAYNATDGDNSSFLASYLTNTVSIINSSKNGTGTYLPMTFYTGGTEKVRIDTSGNLGIGASPDSVVNNTFLTVKNSSGLGGGIIQSKSNDTDLRLQSIMGGGYVGTFTNNSLSFFTNSTEKVKIDATGNVGIGKTATAKLDVNGNIKSDANIAGGYAALAAGTTAMPFAIDNVVRVTPNATATYTSTVPAAGSIVVLSILTSGTVSYTITFGTGFKSTGTLATGTVSARYFNLTFVSDGTNLIETARTVAIA